MRPDPPIDEVRAVRHRISEECGHDPKQLLERYLELQLRYAERLLRSPAPDATMVPEEGDASPAKIP